MRRPLVCAALVLAPAACASHDVAPVEPAPGARALFDLAADVHDPSAFYDLPYPSDLRLGASGGPDLEGLPYPSFVTMFEGLRRIASERPGYPVVPVGYFRFDAPIAPLDPSAVVTGSAAPVLLVDLAEASLLPVIAATPDEDGYVPSGMLAIAPR